MKRTLAISLATLMLMVGICAAPGEAAAVKPCSDINGDSSQSYYVVDGPGNPADEAILSIQITTVEPLCANSTLTVFVSTDGVTFTGYVYPGDTHFTSCGASCLTFTYDYGSTLRAKSSAAPATVSVYLETATGRRVIDRAPDERAVQFDLCDSNLNDSIKTKNYDNTGTVIPPCN